MFDLPEIISIRKIAFIFFALLGITHFLFGSLANARIWLPTSDLGMRISFIPFGVASLVYAYSVLKEYSLERGKIGKGIDYTFAAFIALTLIGLLFIEFYFPDKTPLL